MIALGVSLTSHKVLGHYVIRNPTKFQSCRSNDKFVISEIPSQKHFDKNNIKAWQQIPYNICLQ